MACRKITVTTPYGTFTRETPHDYKFVIVTCGMRPDALQLRAKDRLLALSRDLAYFVEENDSRADEWREKIADLPAFNAQIVVDNDEEIKSKRGKVFGFSRARVNADQMAQGARHIGYQIVEVFPVPSPEA